LVLIHYLRSGLCGGPVSFKKLGNFKRGFLGNSCGIVSRKIRNSGSRTGKQNNTNRAYAEKAQQKHNRRKLKTDFHLNPPAQWDKRKTKTIFKRIRLQLFFIVFYGK
jgi:hypothetical protein